MFRSRYLLAIVGVVGLYEIVSTVMDFQFTSTVVHYLDGPDIGQWFASVYALTNGVSLVVHPESPLHRWLVERKVRVDITLTSRKIRQQCLQRETQST